MSATHVDSVEMHTRRASPEEVRDELGRLRLMRDQVRQELMKLDRQIARLELSGTYDVEVIPDGVLSPEGRRQALGGGAA